jgi:chromosome segregation protein
MNIKKLELSGFKSFVDRTVLHFDHDIFGIVGPNGCGKSNIVDAIRWCMGEQSARHLRGRSMEDVIFSGSETRTAQDFAEVTLTFENDAPHELPHLPLEYRDYAEIAVTRRLHRSGESEYLINKTPVRLRDVTDLFLGTGAGTKAYSIVEQGKVGLIVSAKPEDRRLLIEEAAGITKFKSRKKQAERKMELTQQNLLRLGDIVGEIERNVASLKRQAAKAERYLLYRNEVEDLQLHEAAHRYLELVGWLKLEADEVERLSQASEMARLEVDTCDAELHARRLEAHAAEQVLEAAQLASFGAENEVRAEKAAIERANDRIASLERREQQAVGEKREMAEQAARLATEHDTIERSVAGLADQESDQQTRLSHEEANLTDCAAAHAIADARVVEHRQSIAKGQAQIASAEASLTAFDRRSAEMSTQWEKLIAVRESLEAARVEDAARADELRRSVEDLRAGRVSTAVEKTKLEERLAELRLQIHAQERMLEESKAELSAARSRVAALEEMHARLEGMGAGTKALVGTRDACIVGLVADRIEAPPALTQALAGLLGARLQDVVVRDLDRGVALLEQLARGGQGRATIVPLCNSFVASPHPALPALSDAAQAGVLGRLADALRFTPEDEALVRALVGDALIVRDLSSAMRLHKDGVRAALVTLDGAVLHADGRIAGGQGDAVAAGVLESKREARELSHKIERLDAVVTHRFESLQTMRAEMARTGAALDGARREVHERELALVTADKDLQKAEEGVQSVGQRLATLAVEEQDLQRAIAGARDERGEAARQLFEAQASVQAAEAELRDADAALHEARDLLDVQRQAVTVCKVAIAETREKLAAERASAARLARSIGELSEHAQRIDAELVANARERSETNEELTAHNDKLRAAVERAFEAESELTRKRADFEQLRTALVEREGALKELRERFDALRDELRAHEMAQREKQLALEHLIGGVADKFRGLRLPRVIGDYHMRAPPDDVSRARTAELLRLVDRMGSVNLDATREYDENQKRYEFYTVQKADLEKALLDLTRAIQQMNRESRRLFQETFDAVNARFRDIFPRMFRGGRAELRMTSPEDLLETGIDIVAQPPGKRLSSIELMSGGEKALTAVSLIFAIFQTKPSPFCILDEVDAPLDDANVVRYNEMVRSMTDESQFILITHSKRTMECADVLYGVTMGEPGVSKIVSVKINEERAQANSTGVAVA